MCNDFFNPLADSERIISRELQFLNKHADLCRKLIYLVFFFKKIQMCWNYDKVNITSIVSKIPAAVLRHVLTSPKQLNKIKVICPLIYLLSYTEFFTRKGIKTHFLLKKISCACFDNYNCKRKMLLISSDLFNADLLFMWRQRMAEECSNRKQN